MGSLFGTPKYLKMMLILASKKSDIENISYLHNYYNLHVCPSFHPVTSHLQVSLHLEVQKPSQIAAEQGKAELRILNFKTTWSEF